jgi:hypothetical protein
MYISKQAPPPLLLFQTGVHQPLTIQAPQQHSKARAQGQPARRSAFPHPTTHHPTQLNRPTIPIPHPTASETGTLSQLDKWQFAASLSTTTSSLSGKDHAKCAASEGLHAVRRKLHAAICALLSQPPLLTLHASFFSSRIFAFAACPLRCAALHSRTLGSQLMG